MSKGKTDTRKQGEDLFDYRHKNFTRLNIPPAGLEAQGEIAGAFSSPQDGNEKIVLYQTPDGRAALEVRFEGETIWLSLNQIAALFERDKSVISRHLSNIFHTGELERKSVVAFFATTAADSKTYNVEYFNLDVIISVGYRVNSKRGTQFRIWATNVLRDHLVRGYTLNEKRLQVQTEKLAELQKTVGMMGRILASDWRTILSSRSRCLSPRAVRRKKS